MGVRDYCAKFTASPGNLVLRNPDGSYSYHAPDSYVAPNFQAREFNVEGLKYYGIMEKTVAILQKLRDLFGPVTVTSGFRNPPRAYNGFLCPADDPSVNTWYGPHADGLAVDFVCNASYLDVWETAFGLGVVRLEAVLGSTQRHFGQPVGSGGHVHLDVYDGSGVQGPTGTIYDSPASESTIAWPWFAAGLETVDPATGTSRVDYLITRAGHPGGQDPRHQYLDILAYMKAY